MAKVVEDAKSLNIELRGLAKYLIWNVPRPDIRVVLKSLMK